MSLDVSLHDETTPEPLYEDNITHNLAPMAKGTGVIVYEAVWRPDEYGFTQAWQLIDILNMACRQLGAHPDRYRQFNPANGWGSYEALLAFLQAYRAACERYPNALIRVSR